MTARLRPPAGPTVVLALLLLGLLAPRATRAGEALRPPFPSDAAIQARIESVQALYRARREALARRVGERLGIDLAETGRRLQPGLRERARGGAPGGEGAGPAAPEDEESLYRYLEAYTTLENRLRNDHRFVGEMLAELGEILDLVTAKDPLLRYAFRSSAFKRRYGTLLRRVVWQSTGLRGLAAETAPLDVHTVFADPKRVPILVELTPRAFRSLPYLRSILVHELEHVLLFRHPVLADATRFAGGAERPAEGPFSAYFRSLDPGDPRYQYHLVHEAYSLEAQLRFDDCVQGIPYFALDAAIRHRIDEMLRWTRSQLNASNRAYLEAHPTPPLFEQEISCNFPFAGG